MTLEERIDKGRETNDGLAREIEKLTGESLADFGDPLRHSQALKQGRLLMVLQPQKKESDERLKSLRQQMAKRTGISEVRAERGFEDSERATAYAFVPSPDYRSVNFRGKVFSFTSRQAQVVEMLHKAFNSGAPDLGKDYILAELGSRNSRLRDTFKNHGAWNFLIVSGTKRGTHRLNLPDPHS